jgi:CRP/FNR family transcriptional regulator, cyclic AMP receptor protein
VTIASDIVVSGEEGAMGGKKRRQAGHKIDTLAGIRLFSASSRDELEKLAQLFDEVERPAGSVLVREGDPGSEFYVIVAGTATATIGGSHVATLGHGDFFGEMSLLDRSPRAATVTADSDLELLVADARSFASLVDAAPSVGMRMMRMMSERLRSVEATAAAH